MGRRNRRALTPSLESIERRDLLSAIGPLQAARSPSAGDLANRAADLAHATTTSLATVHTDQFGEAPENIGVPVPAVPGQGQPTRRELARERFRAGFNGPVYYGPGRFSDQARTFFFRGVGGSSQFLHGDFQMAVVIPTDPSAPTVGVAYLQDKNNSNGAQVGLDLVAVPGAVDGRGRPNRFTFTADPNVYSGPYYADTAQGTAKVAYHGNTAAVTFKGRIYTAGLYNPVANSDLVGRGGRTFRRA